MPVVETSVKMEQHQQIGMQVCSAPQQQPAPLSGSAAAAWMQQEFHQQQLQQQELQDQQQAMSAAAVAAQMHGYHEAQAAAGAATAMQAAAAHPAGADLHPAAGVDGMVQMMAAAAEQQQQQQQHPQAIGGLPGTLLMDPRWGCWGATGAAVCAGFYVARVSTLLLLYSPASKVNGVHAVV